MAQIGRRLSLAAVLVDLPKGNRATSPRAGGRWRRRAAGEAVRCLALKGRGGLWGRRPRGRRGWPA